MFPSRCDSRKIFTSLPVLKKKNGSFTSLLTFLASTALANECLSHHEANDFAKRWLSIWGTGYMKTESQLTSLVTKDVLSYDGAYGGATVGIDALYASATFVDPLVMDVLQVPEWVFHSCDQIVARWSYTAVSTGKGSTKPAGTPIFLEGIEILHVDLHSRLIFNSTSSAD